MVVALEHIRRLRGLSQRELAEKAGVSPATVYELEVGKRPTPRPSTLRKLAEALEVEIADLLGEHAVPLAKAPGETGLADADPSGKLTAAMALEEIAELWAEQLARGFYDVRTLNKMRVAAYVLAQYHEGAARDHRETLPPTFRAQLEAAEERLAEVVAQIWDLEEVGSDYPMSRDESAAKRKAKQEAKREELLQQLRGSVQTKARSRIGA